MSEIRTWLEALDLGQYADAFEAEQVLIEHLPELTSDDLKDLGLPLGPRKTLLKATRPPATESAPSPLPQPVSPAPSAAADRAAVAADASPADENPDRGTTITAGGERRQLTVMFCDLVDSTALSGRLDPEDLRNVVRAYQETAAAVITRYEGHIAQYLGDGLLVYFGHPHAHEDDAARAVHSGLEIIDAMGALNTSLQSTKGVQLAVRLGIHTGVVVIGEMGGGEQHGQLALGDTPNIAARLEGLAAPDTIVISATTARLVQSAFALEDLGPQTLKGVTEPMMAARVLQPSAAPSDATAEPTEGGRFLIGRDEEVGLLRRRWEQSCEGSGQAVVVTGEAGIGKSVLLETLYGPVAQAGGVRITLRCSPYHQNSTLYPFIQHLQRVFQFDRDDTPAVKLEKLERQMAAYQFTQDETIPLFAALLSLPLPAGRYPVLTLSPQQQKDYTHDALVAWLTEETERAPVLAVFEDLHWADASTMELVGAIVEEVPTVRMLTVATARPEFVPPWPPRSHLTPLTLNRLERPQVAVLVTHLAGDKTLPGEFVQHVVSKTDGVPLFVEELTKMLLESDVLRLVDGGYELTGPLTNVTIPSTLQDSLMARLDRLPEGKEVAQMGAVLGREFAYDMIEALTTEVEATLQARLGELVEAELLYQRGRPPRSKYTFKHALIQDAAYASLLRGTRQAYHQSVAQLLEQQFPDLVESQPELIAHHYTEADALEQALPYWLKAGQRAAQRSANVNAISHLNKGLEVVFGLPDTPARAHQELALQAALGPVLMATKGYAASETGKAYSRARALCERTGETPKLFPVLFGLWGFYIVRADHATAQVIAEELLGLAQQQKDTALLVGAHFALGSSKIMTSDLPTGWANLEQGIAQYGSQPRPDLALQYGHDPAMSCGVIGGMALWSLGYPDQASKRLDAALALAHEVNHPHSLAYANGLGAITQQLRLDPGGTKALAQVGTRLSREQGYPFLESASEILLGWVSIEEGQGGAGIDQIREAIKASRVTGAELFLPQWLAILAEGQFKAGQVNEGLGRPSPRRSHWSSRRKSATTKLNCTAYKAC